LRVYFAVFTKSWPIQGGGRQWAFLDRLFFWLF
jgi:hypothetical protein